MSTTMTPAEVLAVMDAQATVSDAYLHSDYGRDMRSARAAVSALVAERDALRSELKTLADYFASYKTWNEGAQDDDSETAEKVLASARAALAGAGQ